LNILLTGAAGFIGFHTATKLLSEGHHITGYDNVNDYYDPFYKELRLKALATHKNFKLIKGNLEDADDLHSAWQDTKPDRVLHLAAQAGVRYSIENPHAYISSNIIGFQNVIELVRQYKPENFVYASSSSVYGGNKVHPFSESQDVSSPVSLYAATKKSNELVASCYSHLYGIPSTGLRFFTVYGPYSRPDMALFKFAKLMGEGKPIPVFNNGEMVRDFTYVDDIVDGICRALNTPEMGQVYNLGRGKPMKLMEMIELLEKEINITAKKEFMPIQPGDVPKTIADVSKAHKNLGYSPKVDLAEGISHFASWFKEYVL